MNQETNYIKPVISATGLYGKGWDLFKKYFIELFIITIVVTAAFIPIGLANDVSGHGAGSAFMKLFAFFYLIFVFSAIDYGALFAFVKGSRGTKPEITDIYKVKDNYLNVILAKLVTMFIIGFGIVMLIIPGIYFACKLVFVPYLVVDKNMDITEAIRKSWEMTDGYGWLIFRMGFLAIPVTILGLLLCGVGVIFSIMWIRTSFANLYSAFDKNEEVPPLIVENEENTNKADVETSEKEEAVVQEQDSEEDNTQTEPDENTENSIELKSN